MPPSTPATPPRPARSLERLLISPSTPELVFGSPDSEASSLQSPRTPPSPTSPPPARRHTARRSINVIRRKPVPATSLDLEYEMTSLQSDSITPHSDWPRHREEFAAAVPESSFQSPHTPLPVQTLILEVDPPISPYSSPLPPPSYGAYPLPGELHNLSSADPFTTPSTSHPELEMFSVPGSRVEDLPTYAEDPQTEPKTLARALWRWGWVIPIAWVLGMWILWIPLKPLEEETNPEAAQKVEEMIVILRKAEIKYARRCLYGVLAWCCIILAIVLICVLISVLRK